MANNKLSELTVQFKILKLIADLQRPKTLPIHTCPIHSVESITLLRLKDSWSHKVQSSVFIKSKLWRMGGHRLRAIENQ